MQIRSKTSHNINNTIPASNSHSSANKNSLTDENFEREQDNNSFNENEYEEISLGNTKSSVNQSNILFPLSPKKGNSLQITASKTVRISKDNNRRKLTLALNQILTAQADNNQKEMQKNILNKLQQL